MVNYIWKCIQCFLNCKMNFMMNRADMKKLIAVLAALWLVVAAGLALADGEAYTYAVVNNPNPNDRLNLRMAPSRDAASIGKYYNGVVVKILSGVDGTWSQVQVGEVEGYMMTRYLVVYDGRSSRPAVEPVMPQAELRNPYANIQNLLTTPGAGMQLLVPIPNGAPITVLGTADRYMHIQYGGMTGYVPADCVALTPYEGAESEETEPLFPIGSWWPIATQEPVAEETPPLGLMIPKSGIARAELRRGGFTDVLLNKNALHELTQMLQAVEYRGEGISGCPFDATLTVEFADGTREVVQIATDSCCIFRYNGHDYAYARNIWNEENGVGNSVLFELFE